MTTDHAKSRDAHRYKIFQPGHWSRDDVSYPLHLLDISQSGARAYAAEPPPANARVLVDCGVALGMARVTWVAERGFGLRFAVPLSLETIDRVAGTQLRLRDTITRLPSVR